MNTGQLSGRCGCRPHAQQHLRQQRGTSLTPAAAAAAAASSVHAGAAAAPLLPARFFAPAVTAAVAGCRRPRRCCVQPLAAARQAARRSGGGGGRRAKGGTASTRKGFGQPDARALSEPWEARLPPPYRAYYRAGFKPKRFVGPIELKKAAGAESALLHSFSRSPGCVCHQAAVA